MVQSEKSDAVGMFCCFSLHAVSVCVGGVGSGAAGDKNLISAVVIEIEEANLLGECEVMTWRQAAHSHPDTRHLKGCSPGDTARGGARQDDGTSN